MKKIHLLSITILLLLLACKSTSNRSTNLLSVRLESKSNSNVTGVATFSEYEGVVTLEAKFAGLTPGIHAIHIHEKADCSANDASSAGGHWNPTFKKHGKWGEGEYHKGDIGNFKANEKGIGMITFSTNEWCIGCGDATKDILEKGLIVHVNPDDFSTQPTGNAGGRVACAALIR
jgi:superoxide dismutase, Cu-Zn family